MKYKLILILSLFSCTLFPLETSAKVSINEVAWMGNTLSQYGEWIELYNDGADTEDLKDAILYEGGGTVQIAKLTKSIAPGGYYLIARSTPSMPDPVNGLADDLVSFGGSGLSNSGEYLVLKSASGETLDSLDGTSGWPAGDSATKQTMQKSGSAWITATGTPRVLNSSSAAVSAGSNTASSGSDNSPAASAEADPYGLSSHSSPADLSAKVEDVKIFASAGRNRLVLADTPVNFEEKLTNSKNEDLDGGNVTWSFGDGQTATGKVAMHTYKFLGDYVVVMNVIKNAETHVARTSVRVVPAELAVTEFTADLVKIKNSSDYEANLGGWQLVSSRAAFKFPEDTIVMPKREVTFSKEVTGFGADSPDIQLLSPGKNVVAVFKPKKVEVVPGQTATSTTLTPVALEIVTIQQQLLEARKQLELLTAKPAAAVLVSKLEPALEAEKKVEQPEIVQVIEKPKSIFKTVFDMPVFGLRYLKSLVF